MSSERTHIIDENNAITSGAGGVMFAGPKAVDRYILIALKSALKGYALFKMKMNSAWTPTNMLLKATEFTGKKYKRGQYMQAHDDLQEILDQLKAAEAQANA